MRSVLCFGVFAVGLYAQGPVIQGMPMPAGIMPFQQNFEALKEAVGLTDEQIKKMREIQQAHTAASQSVYVQISAKQNEVNNLLAAGSPDATAIGKLEIEINALRAQVSKQVSSREELLNVLNPAQKKQLEKLQEAMQLQRAVSEANQVGLLQYAAPVPPKPVPVALGPARKESK